MKRATYCDILGLNNDASKNEVKSAFRKLAIKYHPDKNPTNENAHNAFIIINKAYEVLINDQARSEYDAFLGKYKNRVYSTITYGREYDPLVQKALSEFGYLLWDLEDLLKRITDKQLIIKVRDVDLYEYLLNLLQYLEKEVLGEEYRYSSYIQMSNRKQSYLENYYYLLRIDVEKYIKNMDQKKGIDPNQMRKIEDAKNRLTKYLGDVCKFI